MCAGVLTWGGQERVEASPPCAHPAAIRRSYLDDHPDVAAMRASRGLFQPDQPAINWRCHALASSAAMRLSSSCVSSALRRASTMPASVAPSPGSRSPAATAFRMRCCASATAAALVVSGKGRQTGRSFAGGSNRSITSRAAVRSPQCRVSRGRSSPLGSRIRRIGIDSPRRQRRA